MAEFAEKEIEGDVKYAARQIEKDFKEAEVEESLENILKNYFHSLKKIIRRFITRNEK